MHASHESAATAALQLATLYRFNRHGRLVSTLEPDNPPAPAFVLIRDVQRAVWALHQDLPPSVADTLRAWAADEGPLVHPEDPPAHAAQYQELLGGPVEAGPAFRFPGDLPQPADVVRIDDPAVLATHFGGGWEDILGDGRQPVMGILRDQAAVSVCFSARWSDEAAEAGVETAEAARGRGLAPRVVAAWATAVRTAGRVPLYSTSWRNTASRRVAAKLGLMVYAADWSIGGRDAEGMAPERPSTPRDVDGSRC